MPRDPLTSYTASVEPAKLSSPRIFLFRMLVFLTLCGGGLWVLQGGQWAFLLPGGAVTELVRLAWHPGGAWFDGWRDVAVMVTIAGVAGLLAWRYFRWDPRTG